MERPNSVSHCLWPSLISSALQNIQDIWLGNTMILFSLFFHFFSLRMHNWCSVYQCCLHSCALLESFRVTGLQGVESWLGPLPPKREQELATQISDQHRHGVAVSPAVPMPAQVHFALFQHCRPPHILPELWKFKSDSWLRQVGRARMRNAEIHPSQPFVCFWV